MSTTSLASAFGFHADGSLPPGSKLQKVLPQFVDLKDKPLDQVPFKSANAAVTFDDPFSFSSGALTLDVGASAGGSVRLVGGKDWVLDEDDPFSAIAVKPSEIYVGLGLDSSVTAAISGTVESMSFGLAVTREVDITCYRRFHNDAGAFPSFSQGLAATAGSFTLPTNAADLSNFPVDVVLVVAGDGVLTVNGGVTFSTPVQTLASVSLPMGKTLDVNPAGSFNTSVTFTLTGGYQIRLRRLAPRTVEIGVYVSKSRELALSVNAEAGVAAEVGTFDLAQNFLAALSRQPVIDLAEFNQALPGEDPQERDEQIEDFQACLKESISTNVQAAATTTFSTLKSNEAAWLFEIDFDAATSDQARAAITSALKGDFRPLTADPHRLPAGITQTENILTQTNLGKQELQINLLGVVNFLSLTKLVRTSQVERNAAGAITLITDTSSASRLQALTVIAGLDKKRLRKMLSEKFVIEAAYHAAGLGLLPPDFKAKQTYFEVNDHTGRQELKDGLDVARILGLITPGEEDRRLSGANFGRTTFYVQTRYTDQQTRRLFLDESGKPRASEYYETSGRSALAASLLGDTGQELRQSFAQLGSGDVLWSKMKATGNVAAFGPLFGLPSDSTDPRLAAVGSDFITIVTWASAMSKAAVALREVQDLLGKGPVDPGDARLKSARDRLKTRMEDVVKDTHEHFGDPLGLLMVYVASQESAERQVIVTGPQIETLEANSQSDQAAHA